MVHIFVMIVNAKIINLFGCQTIFVNFQMLKGSIEAWISKRIPKMNALHNVFCPCFIWDPPIPPQEQGGPQLQSQPNTCSSCSPWFDMLVLMINNKMKQLWSKWHWAYGHCWWVASGNSLLFDWQLTKVIGISFSSFHINLPEGFSFIVDCHFGFQCWLQPGTTGFWGAPSL